MPETGQCTCNAPWKIEKGKVTCSGCGQPRGQIVVPASPPATPAHGQTAEEILAAAAPRLF